MNKMVDVFERADIERIQPDSVADLIGKVAGISTSFSGTKANTTSLFVRGSNSDHVLVLVNGVRVGSGTLGGKNLGLVSLALIERVEIVRGPRAALWGSDALGAVVQIFTREFDAGQGQAGVALGHDNYQQAYASLGLGNKDHQYTISVNGERSDGFNIGSPFAPNEFDGDGYSQKAIALTGNSQINDNYRLELAAQLEDGNTEFDASFGGNEADHKNHHILVRNHIDLNEATYLQVGYANSRDNSITFGNNSLSFFDTKRDQVTALAQFNLSADSEIIVGTDFYNERVSSTNDYDVDERNVYALFITGRKEIDALRLEASLRYDDVEKIDQETTFQVAAGYQVNEQLLVSLSHGSAFKSPTFNDLYFPNFGNPNLVSETADNTELLTRYQSDNFSAEVSVFYSDFENFIDFDAANNFAPSNIQEVIVKGIESSISAQYLGLQHTLTISHIDAEDQRNHKQLRRRPYLNANYALGYQGDNWDISFDIQLKGKNFEDAGNTDAVAAYTLFSLAANYQMTNNLNLNAKISNLSDKDYTSVRGFNTDGRGFRVGLDYRF